MNENNISKVYLLSVPLEDDYKHTLYFTSKASQQSYFQSNIVRSFTDFSYQRKDKIIRIPVIYDDIYNCNYVMYQNSKYGDKWFYAFITKLEYVNDGRTDVYIETDVIQTWLFDYTVKSSFVEREHVDNDTVGLHTVPENVEMGEYIINDHVRDVYNTNLTIVLQATLTPGEMVSFVGGKYQGVPTGVRYYEIHSVESLRTILEAYSNGHADAIVGLFLAPKYLVNSVGGVIEDSDNPVSYDMKFDRINSLNGYTPVNKKLLTYPYCYMLVSNAQGSNAVFKQERWKLDGTGKMVLRFYGVLTPGCSIKAIPIDYNGGVTNIDESINLGKFPTLNWTTDQYTNWLTQNAVNIGVSTAGNLLSIVGGVAAASTGVGAGVGAAGVTSGLMGIASSVGQVYQHSFMPPQASGNLNSGDVTSAMDENRFHIYKMTIKDEYARIIDGYFNMFGYKVNTVKVPNKAHRSRYWYTKCIDVNIDGDIPNEDMQTIKNAYNNGITFWRNASEIQNYSLSNEIV